MTFTLICDYETGRKAPGPVGIEKLAKALQLEGNARDQFVEAGCRISKCSGIALGPSMASPSFRGVLKGLFESLGITGEILEFTAEYEVGKKALRYDLAAHMADGRLIGLEFKAGRILVALCDPRTGQLPLPSEKAILANGGFIADFKLRGSGEKPGSKGGRP